LLNPLPIRLLLAQSSYRKYNYILGGAMDGGAQTMIFILSYAVFGAAGVERPFPSVCAIPNSTAMVFSDKLSA